MRQYSLFKDWLSYQGAIGGNKMNKSTVLTIVLVVLVLISVVQAFQLNGLKTKVAEGKFTVAAGSGGSSTPQSSIKKTASVPKSIQNLPQMVGGC